MTHDELLTKINYDIEGNPYDEYMQALRAVVELCKSRAYKNETDEMYIKGWNAAMNKVIQAIEKELK